MPKHPSIRRVRRAHQPINEKGLKDIRKHFGFLFERGYEIYSAKDYPDAPWPVREVVLKKEDLFLKIYEERGYIEKLSFKGIEIGSMIYFLSGGKENVGNLAGVKQYANLMRKYIDEIEFRLGDDYSGFKQDIQSSQKKYDEARERSSSWPGLIIVIILASTILISGAVMLFIFYNELIFNWWLSGLLVDIGYSSSSWLIRGVSLLLAIGSVYMIYWLIRKSAESEGAAKIVTKSTGQTNKWKSLFMAIIFFPLFWIAFAFLIGAVLSVIPSSNVFEIVFPILTFGLSFLLALWIAFSIYNSNRG